MINPDNAVFLSSLPNLKIINSGVHDHDVVGTYVADGSAGTVQTYKLASGIDVNKHMVLMFGTENRNDPAIAYQILPTSYSEYVLRAGINELVFTDAYFFVDPAGDLYVEYKNVSFGVNYPITTEGHSRTAWYVVEATPIT